MVFYRILPKLAGVLFSVALAVILSVMLAGCSSSSEPQKKTPVQMTVVFPQAAKAQKARYATDTPIASVTIEVSGPEMMPMSSTVVASSGKTAAFDLDIPNGQDRLILAKILDPYGDILFQGSITARLDGAPLALSIALQPVALVSGKTDRSFGQDGQAIFSQEISGGAMVMQFDGRILLAGTTDVGDDFVVIRSDASGALDTGFGTGGKAVLDLGGTDVLSAMAIQSNGEILLAGTTDVGKTEDFVVVGYTTSGQLNTAFGQAGQKIYDLGEGDQVHSLGIQSSGRIVVSGNTEVNGVNALALVRYYP